MKRFLGVVIVVSALLIFVNACEADSDTSAGFRSGEYVESQLDSALEQHRDDQLHFLALECGSLIACVGGIALLLFKG